MSTVSHSVSPANCHDQPDADRIDLIAWLAAIDRGHYEDEAPEDQAVWPTEADDRWWADQLAHTERPGSELDRLHAGHWSHVESCYATAYEMARDAGFDVFEAGAEAEAARQAALLWAIGDANADLNG